MTGNPHIARSIPIQSESIHLQEEVLSGQLAAVETEDFGAEADWSGLNQIYGKFKELEKFKSPPRTVSKENSEEKKVQKLAPIEAIAERFQERNDELKKQTLLFLLESLDEGDEEQQILEKTLKYYKEVSLADEALDFLIEATDDVLQLKVQAAKDKLNQEFSKEIKAGKNIQQEARSFSEQGLGTAVGLRDLYRDIIFNPRAPIDLFQELSQKFPYEQLQVVVLFLLHSLGKDLHAKGPSIDRVELIRLIDEIRSLQGIFGVYRFFERNIESYKRQFLQKKISFPSNLNFVALGRIFIRVLSEKYLGSEKIIQVLHTIGLESSLNGQYLLCVFFHRALRQIALRYFRNRQHFEEVHQSFLDALDALDDAMEELDG